MKNLVFGLNCPILPDGTVTYDGNVACLQDGKPVMALAEERISRRKYDGSFRAAFEFMMKRLDATICDIDAISICSFAQPYSYPGPFPDRVSDIFKSVIDTGVRIHYVQSHHEAHAFSAICQSQVSDAIIAVIDHTGNILGSNVTDTLENNRAEQTSYYLVRDGKMSLVAREHDLPGDAGYGRLYGDVTCYLGFNSYRESGKTMGLASFGDEKVLEKFRAFTRSPDGKELANLAEENYCEDCTKDIANWFKNKGLVIPARRKATDLIRPFDMHLAAWVQDQIQGSIARRIKTLMETYAVKNVCLAGGVAMNSVLNTYLEETLGANLFIPPSPGDAGIALGAAAQYLFVKDGRIPGFGPCPYLGPLYDEQEIQYALEHYCEGMSIEKCTDVTMEAASAMAANKIIGWFQGRSEYGPRALGNRSILSSPRNSWTKEILNSQVKLREWFRPYAPAVRLEDAGKYFHLNSEVPHMMKIARVKPAAQLEIPACIHVDGTARLQTVTRESNELFHHLIGTFGALTGTPVILNTSFNLAGMPIVESPYDAIQCFKKSIGMDMLFIGDNKISKNLS